MIKIREASYEDVLHIIQNLHADDVQELEQMSGKPKWEAMKELVLADHETFVVAPVLDGIEAEPVALFGCTRDRQLDGWGVVWMMSTPMLRATSIDIIKLAPAYFNEWLIKFPEGLHNLIDSRNERHIKWLKRMGAKFNNERMALIGDPPVPFFHFILR